MHYSTSRQLLLPSPHYRPIAAMVRGGFAKQGQASLFPPLRISGIRILCRTDCSYSQRRRRSTTTRRFSTTNPKKNLCFFQICNADILYRMLGNCCWKILQHMMFVLHTTGSSSKRCLATVFQKKFWCLLSLIQFQENPSFGTITFLCILAIPFVHCFILSQWLKRFP